MELAALAIEAGIFGGGLKAEFVDLVGVDIAGIDGLGGIDRQFRPVAEAEGVERVGVRRPQSGRLEDIGEIARPAAISRRLR